MADHPVALHCSDDLRRNRWTVLFRLLLALPHVVCLSTLAVVAIVLSPILGIATFVRRTPPPGLAELYVLLVRSSAQVNAYAFLLSDRFPPFFAMAPHPVDVRIDSTAPQGRWSIAFRFFLGLPAMVLATALGVGIAGSASWGAVSVGVLPTVGILAWFACLARGRMPRGMRDLGLYTVGYGAQTGAYLFWLTGRYPDSDPALVPALEAPDHPVRLRLAVDDLRRHRLLVFFRLPLAAPHIVWLSLWSVLAVLVALAGWLAALITGRLPRPLHRFLAALARYGTHVYAFLYLGANEFPGFTGAAGRYPVELEIAPPERQGRWTILVRLVLAIPAFLIVSSLSTVQLVAAILGWWAALITGRMPRGLRNLQLYALRYGAQANAYLSLLTPRYPYSGPEPCDRVTPQPPSA